jgi:hypothetical protein
VVGNGKKKAASKSIRKEVGLIPVITNCFEPICNLNFEMETNSINTY